MSWNMYSREAQIELARDFRSDARRLRRSDPPDMTFVSLMYTCARHALRTARRYRVARTSI